jgi:hypothetical protein
MPDGLTYVALILGFSFVLIAGARLGAGSQTILAGLFPPPAVRDWPVGVQEPDAPRFAVAHLDALRPGRAPTPEPDDPVESADIFELFERPLSNEAACDRIGRPASSPTAC